MVVSNVVRERNVGVCGGWGWGSKAREVILGRCTRVTVGTNGFHGPVVLLRSALSLHTTHSAARAGLATLVSTSAQRRFDSGVHTASAGTEILPTRQAGHRRKSTVCTHYVKAKEY